MIYIKLFWKTRACRLAMVMTAVAAVLCAAAAALAALVAGAALSHLLEGSEGFRRLFAATVLLWLAGQVLLRIFANYSAERLVFSLKQRVLAWFLKENGNGDEAKMLCDFGISRQVGFFVHAYLYPWMAILSLAGCLVLAGPAAALLLCCWGAVSLGVSHLLSRLTMGRQRAYGKAYMDEMGLQYELLQDADGVRERGEERAVVSRLIGLWRKFRKQERRLYYVFSAARLGSLGLTALGACLFCLLHCAGLLSAKSLGVLLYGLLLILPGLRWAFHKGPWVEKSRRTCAQLLDIVNGEAAE